MSRQESLRRAFRRLVSEEDIRQIIARVVQQAQAGDPAAAQLVLEFTLGPPLSFQEMTGEENDEQDRD